MDTTTELPVSTEQSGREPSAGELAAMGLGTSTVEFKPQPPAEVKPAAETKPDGTQDSPEEPFVGKLLTRGRPARDLSGLDEEETKLFQSMSRQAYEKLFPLYKSTKGKDLSKLDELTKIQTELESLKKANKPSSVYDHEEGYLLDRSYRQALVERNQLQDVEKFYIQQLAAVREGKPYHNITQDKDGNLLVDPTPIPHSPAADAQLTAAISQIQQLKSAHAAKLDEIKGSFNKGYTNFRTNLAKVHDQVFGPYKEQLTPLAEKELQAFPEEVRDRQEIVSLATAIALLRHIAAQHGEETRVANATAANNRVARSVGPTMRSIAPAPATAGKELQTSDAEFKQFRNQFGI